VLNLFGVYVRWALLAGKTDPVGHNASMTDLVEYLSREQQARPHLGEFLDRWNSSSRPMPMMVPEASSSPRAERQHLSSEDVLP
jgi:hypothetical protein